jgi:hypothetical protein
MVHWRSCQHDPRRIEPRGVGHVTICVVSSNDASLHRPITLDINLRSSAPSGQGGQFFISAATAQASSETNIHSAPVDSRLDLQASTRYGANRVKLPAAFEGLFSSHKLTAQSFLYMEDDESISDPAGEGRVRDLVLAGEDGVGFSGSVAWLPRHKHAMNGTARMVTLGGTGTLRC